MTDGTGGRVITQDPSKPGSKPIARSNNALNGIEFTWSIWLYINQIQADTYKYQHIFHKGNNGISTSNGINSPNNGPGLYISKDTNELILIVDTFTVVGSQHINDTSPNVITIGAQNNSRGSGSFTGGTFPMKKWVNVMVRCKNTTIEVYVNGMMDSSTQLPGVPKQNYGDIYMSLNNGFNGYTSNLSYYPYALGISSIQNIVAQGPNLKMASGGDSAMTQNYNDYLSLRWFFYRNGGQYFGDYPSG
jgi:hypothetical protein